MKMKTSKNFTKLIGLVSLSLLTVSAFAQTEAPQKTEEKASSLPGEVNLDPIAIFNQKTYSPGKIKKASKYDINFDTGWFPVGKVYLELRGCGNLTISTIEGTFAEEINLPCGRYSREIQINKVTRGLTLRNSSRGIILYRKTLVSNVTVYPIFARRPIRDAYCAPTAPTNCVTDNFTPVELFDPFCSDFAVYHIPCYTGRAGDQLLLRLYYARQAIQIIQRNKTTIDNLGKLASLALAIDDAWTTAEVAAPNSGSSVGALRAVLKELEETRTYRQEQATASSAQPYYRVLGQLDVYLRSLNIETK